MTAILCAWALAATVLLLIAMGSGELVRRGRVASLVIDRRGRFSLNRLQLLLWGTVVVSLAAGVFFGRLIDGVADPFGFTIPGRVLGLLGISVGSTAVVGVAKATKAARAGTATLASAQATGRAPVFWQVFMLEEGEFADRAVDVTKLQSFMVTAVLVTAYVATAVHAILNAAAPADITTLPDVTGWFLALLGISCAGYAGGKVVTHRGAPPAYEPPRQRERHTPRRRAAERSRGTRERRARASEPSRRPSRAYNVLDEAAGRQFATALRGVVALLALRLLVALVVRGMETSVGGLLADALSVLDLSEAFPEEMPERAGPGTPGEVEPADLRDRDRTAELARATAWAHALADADDAGRQLAREQGVMTTYGFASVKGQVRLAVIRYLPPRVVPDRSKAAPVQVGNRRFPVVLRPWVASGQGPGDTGRGRGSCWVTFAGPDGGRRRGILTARHALTPSDAKQGDEVSIDAGRGDPTGRLQFVSPVMDVAVVDVAEDGGEVQAQGTSAVVGYKPVRLLAGMGDVDTEVIEITGFTGATIPGVAGQEPRIPVVLILGKHLRRGDSGCLGLDLEAAAFGGEPTPYLIYQGRTNLRFGGGTGYGLLLEQARRVWSLDVHTEPPNPIDGSAQ